MGSGINLAATQRGSSRSHGCALFSGVWCRGLLLAWQDVVAAWDLAVLLWAAVCMRCSRACGSHLLAAAGAPASKGHDGVPLACGRSAEQGLQKGRPGSQPMRQAGRRAALWCAWHG